MKNFLSFGAIVVFVLFIAGCSKTSGNLMDAGSMTATLGGASFTAANCYESVIVGTTENYYIQGTDQYAHTFVVLNLKGTKLHTGEYHVDGGDNSAWYVKDNGTFYAKSGTVTVNSDSAGVATSGSFNFVATNGATVDGSFRAVFRH